MRDAANMSSEFNKSPSAQATGYTRRRINLLLVGALALAIVLGLAAGGGVLPTLAQDSPLASPLPTGAAPTVETSLPAVFAQPAPPSPLPSPAAGAPQRPIRPIPPQQTQTQAPQTQAQAIPQGTPLRAHTSMVLVGLLLVGLIGLVLVIIFRPGA